MESNSRIGNMIIVLMFITFISKIAGFFREMVMAAYYGAGVETDAFFVAQTLPNIIFAIIGTSLGLIFIPIFIEISTRRSYVEANQFASNILSLTFLISLVFVLLGLHFSPYIVKFMAPGFHGSTFFLAVYLTRVLFPIMLFISLAELVKGIMQSKDHFVLPSLTSILSNVVIILGILFFSKFYGIKAAAWATLFGMSLQLLIQLPLLFKKMSYRWRIRLKDRNIQKFAKLFIPVMIGIAVLQMNIIVDRILASNLQEGSISAISYAERLIGLGISIFAMSIAVVNYPKFSKSSAAKDYEDLKKQFRRSILHIFLILLPFLTGILLLGRELVTIIFGRGAFDDRAIHLTTYALTFYALGIIPFSLREILVRIFFSLKNTITPMANSILAAGINVILDLILIKALGIGGLGLATSLAGLISILHLFHSLKKSMGAIFKGSFLLELIKILISTIIMGLVVFAHKNPLGIQNHLLNLSTNILIGLLVYLLCLSFFNVKEYKLAVRTLRSIKLYKKIHRDL